MGFFKHSGPLHLESNNLLRPLLLLLPVFLAAVQSQTTSVDYCGALGDVYDVCESLTPGFSILPGSVQASCLCTTSLYTLSWGPALFDDLVSDCVSQDATVNPALASSLAPFENFCNDFTTPTSSVGAAASTASSTINYCGDLAAVISYCESQTPGFTTLPDSVAASCLCATTIGSVSWGPALFDGLVSECVLQETTINPAEASSLATLENFCSVNTIMGSSVSTSTMISSPATPGNTPSSGAAPTMSSSAPTSAAAGTTPVSSSTTTVASASSKAAARVVKSDFGAIVGAFVAALAGLY